MSLTKRTVSGFFWTFSQQVSVQFINFIETIILARILLPSEFGLIGMLAVFIAIGNTLIDSGLTSSLIRTANPTEKDYSTVFFINLLGSILIYCILFFTAPLIASFYKQPMLTNIVRLYTLTFIIRAFSSVQMTRLTKELNFKLQMTIQIPSEILGSALGIILALSGFGVWSLVWMNIFQSSMYSIQLWIRSGWRPKFLFDKDLFKYHFNFGYKLTLSSLLDTVYQNLYTLIIGKFFSAAQVGYYTYSMTLRQLPIQNISGALNKITYPIFSSIQNDDIALKRAYKKLMQQVIFWIAPILILLTIIAEPLFRLLLTEKWLPAVPYFQILCIAGILYPLQAYNLNILKIKGRSDLFLKLAVIKKVLSISGVFVALQFGIFGLLYFQIVMTLISFVINTWYSGKFINYSFKNQLSDISPILLVAACTGGAVKVLNIYLENYLTIPDILQLMIAGFIYFSLYLFTSYLIKIDSFNDFSQLILKRFVFNKRDKLTKYFSDK